MDNSVFPFCACTSPAVQIKAIRQHVQITVIAEVLAITYHILIQIADALLQ